MTDESFEDVNPPLQHHPHPSPTRSVASMSVGEASATIRIKLS
jgi:hypothetical protein